ncbi:hypothetical protein GYA93_11425 [Gordonia desulfuricans]|uniref:Uncharacterized protein n=2 Tax=Gordonia desulfuricans TaxID=89051 RepID=A0A7K3LRK6_9ACTN|nr:hypothetical protein [Gordonia desulfuricans]
MLSPANRKERRARERAEDRRSRRMQKAVVALGAGIAIAAGTAGQAYAESIQSQQISQDAYATTENLIVIADDLGRAQIALLAPVGSILPEGWVPVVTSASSTTTEQLNVIQALTEGGRLLLAVPDTSHVPGASTALSGISPQVAQAVSALPLAGTLGSGAGVLAQITSAWAQLNLINPNTVIQNILADGAGTLGGDQVVQHAGELTGIPSFDEALGFWSGTHTTSNWTGTTAWLGATGTTWVDQERVTLNGMTSDQLKALFAQNLNQPDALVVANGSTHLVQVGSQTVVIVPAQPSRQECVTVFGIKKCVTIPAIPEVTQELPIYDTEWEGETDENGNQVHTTTYDPNAAIPGALSALDGIDVGGFSVIQREAGGTYTGPLGGTAGWLAAATQVVVPGTGGADDYVATVPLYAAGISLPDNLFTTGMQRTPGLVTSSGQTVDSVLGSRSFTMSIPGLGLGFERTSLLESSHLGPDGAAYNSGWTVAAVTIGDTTIPLVYSLGSINLGPHGIGVSGPSFMGVGLPGFQLGSAPTGSGSTAIPDALSGILGDVSTSVITLTPALLLQLAQIEDPTNGVLSDPIGTLVKVLDPLFTTYVTPTATQISQAIADAATTTLNQVSHQVAQTSAQVADTTGGLATGAEQGAAQLAAATAGADDTTTSTGRHALPEGHAPQFTSSGTDTPRHAVPEDESSTEAESDTAPTDDVTPSADDAPSADDTPAGASTGSDDASSTGGGDDADGGADAAAAES